MSSLEELFCHVDDFCQSFEPQWRSQLLSNGLKTRERKRSLSLSEVMTILIAFHQSHYRNFKSYYIHHVCRCCGRCTGLSFIDATSLKVCHNRRISQHKVFKGMAARGKTSMGWFYGFKLHLVVSECGELLNITITPGNTDDRKPVIDLLSELTGKVFADRGYVKKALAQELLETFGIEFFAKPKRNMKNKLMRLNDKLLARKRSIVETIIDQLKNISQIEHSRHRSPTNCLVNIICGLIAYCHQPKKPGLHLEWALPPAA